MLKTIKVFVFEDESGVVTVDWVVLTAGLVGMAMLVLIPIAYSTDSLSQGVGGYISSTEIGAASTP